MEALTRNGQWNGLFWELVNFLADAGFSSGSAIFVEYAFFDRLVELGKKVSDFDFSLVSFIGRNGRERLTLDGF